MPRGRPKKATTLKKPKKAKTSKIPKITCGFCKIWYESSVIDAREKVYTKLCHDKEITFLSDICSNFEPHDYFECPQGNRLNIEVCYHRKCTKRKRCKIGKLVTYIIENYRRDNESNGDGV